MVALKASAGTITIPLHLAPGPMSGATVPSGDVEILVNQQPATQNVAFFTAAGLTKGAEHLWNYVWDYRNLKH
jgi:hypothetical protein